MNLTSLGQKKSYYLITKARLSLTHSVVPCCTNQSIFSLSKRVSIGQMAELSWWPSGLDVGLQIWWGLCKQVRIPARTKKKLFLLLCSDASERKARALMRVQSTKPDWAKRPRNECEARSCREIENVSAKPKGAQPEWAQRM